MKLTGFTSCMCLYISIGYLIYFFKKINLNKQVLSIHSALMVLDTTNITFLLRERDLPRDTFTELVVSVKMTPQGH